MVHLSDYRYDSRIQRQATALAERGDSVDLVSVGEPGEWQVGDGVVRAHPVTADKPSGGPRNYLIGYTRFAAAAAAKLTALDRRQRFDLIEVHNMPDALTFSALWPRARGVPLILNLHDTFPELYVSKFRRPSGGPGARIIRFEERVSASMATALITVTDEARLRLASRGVGVGRTLVVMNAPDQSIFGPPREPSVLDATAPEIRMLYHGGTAPRFGVETLIRGFAKASAAVPNARLRVCGPGEDVPALRELAAQLAPTRIEVVGAVPFEQIPDELREAHIGIVPTLRDEFTELLLPVKLLEYVHAGLPVVASRLPGLTGYFSDPEVRLFEPGDSDALASAIADVCGNPGEAHARAVRAATKLEQISWAQQKQGYLELVDQLVGSARTIR